jgi:hypothetical protein
MLAFFGKQVQQTQIENRFGKAYEKIKGHKAQLGRRER